MDEEKEGFQKIYENCETESMGILTLKNKIYIIKNSIRWD